jgi:hypothetical protein
MCHAVSPAFRRHDTSATTPSGPSGYLDEEQPSMTISQSRPANTFLHHPVKVLRRAVTAVAAIALRPRRAPRFPLRSSSLAPPPTEPLPAVWHIDRQELNDALQDSRW